MNTYTNDYNRLPDFVTRLIWEDTLTQKYPFIKRQNIGKSLCGRPIYAYSIGSDQSKTLYAGAFHGMEWLTSLILLRFLEKCAISIEKNRDILCFRMYDFLKAKGLCIIPCVNPDGVEIQLKGSSGAEKNKRFVDSVSKDTSHWQANAGGVDINHNFNAGWKKLKRLEIKNGITKPAPTRYGGKAPESEPETKAIADFCRKENFAKAFAFHSQGREIYYDFGNRTPENSRLTAEILADCTGYKVSAPNGLAVGGGFKDWFIEYFGKCAFTVEIGMGKNPLPLSDFDDEYKRLLPLLCLGAML